eukprot:scaffold94082_cov57-Phaeocystis_antarctica.AAC.2
MPGKCRPRSIELPRADGVPLSRRKTADPEHCQKPDIWPYWGAAAGQTAAAAAAEAAPEAAAAAAAEAEAAAEPQQPSSCTPAAAAR